MPEKKTMQRVRADKRQGKSASTQAGELVREEMDHAKEGKHPVKSRKQAVAIGLSKARRAGIKVKPNPSKSSKRGGAAKTSSSRSSGTRKTSARKPAARKPASRTAPAKRPASSRRAKSPPARRAGSGRARRTS